MKEREFVVLGCEVLRAFWSRMHHFAGEEHATEEGLHRAVLSQLDVEVDAWQGGGQGIPVRLSLRRATGKLDQVASSVPQHCWQKDRAFSLLC